MSGPIDVWRGLCTDCNNTCNEDIDNASHSNDGPIKYNIKYYMNECPQ